MTPNDLGLRADCGSCFALCCVAPGFSASADFAIDKAAGHACPNLQADYRCGIHAQLRPRGFSGCTVYDCFGAGQKVSQVTFGGLDWRRRGADRGQMFDVFAIMRQLHELLWYLADALTRPPAAALHPEMQGALSQTHDLTSGTPEALAALDIVALRARINELLLAASALVRAGLGGPGKDRRGADLVGARLPGADLRGADLRGACLIGAQLQDADLRLADLIGVDFRGCDLRGADLSDSLYVTQTQVNAATGDSRTKVPAELKRPTHWGS